MESIIIHICHFSNVKVFKLLSFKFLNIGVNLSLVHRPQHRRLTVDKGGFQFLFSFLFLIFLTFSCSRSSTLIQVQRMWIPHGSLRQLVVVCPMSVLQRRSPPLMSQNIEVPFENKLKYRAFLLTGPTEFQPPHQSQPYIYWNNTCDWHTSY